ncbi:MAG TPA: thioesterase family protein [Baekduia sp.]|uniref:thioesterase family protein n=1 Tax=Baekduia sp. TaxID=2600305 RepID=UPI002CB25E86|nr:thioesterase family protein [Baekduia sp.]HMJ36910.1 thioesterase family protein [Baekduia sp.]
MTDAVFAPEGEVLIPSEHARGPWDAGAMHGGAPAALIARAIERLETPAPMRCVRLALEFAGAVPLQPVTVSARITRGGKRLALVEAALSTTDGTEVLRARGTLLRIGDVALPAAATPPDAPVPGPEQGRPAHWTGGDETAGFHLTAIDLRFARGDWGHGPAVGWFRLAMPLVAGEEPTPLQRTVAFADFGNGLSRALDFRTHLFVNADLTVHLHREPEGEWVALDARTDLDRTGVGQATSILRDRHGRLGVAAQSLFVAER